MKKHYFLFSVIFLQTFFFLVQLKNHNLYLKDSAEYLTEAANIAESGTFYAGQINQEINPAKYTKRPPLYPLFIRFSRLFSSSDILVIILQNILSVFSIMIMRKIAMDWGYNRNRDQWALLLLIFTPAQFIYANLVMSEILFQFILILVILYFLMYLKHKKLKHLLIYNLLIFIAATVKPVMYLFVIPNLFFLAWLSVRHKTARPVITAMLPLLLVLGYSQWNALRTGRFAFSSIQTTNLVNYNTYYFLINAHGEKYASNTIDSIYSVSNNIDSYSERMAYLDRSAMKIIKAEPVKYGWFHFKGMVRFFLDPGRFDLANFIDPEAYGGRGILYYLNTGGMKGAIKFLFSSGTEGLSFFLVFIMLANLVKIGGILLFTLNRRVDILTRIFLILLIVYLVFATGPLGASRFAVPLIPVVIFMTLTRGNLEVLKAFTTGGRNRFANSNE